MATQTRNGVTWSYTYDANGMRTKRSSDSATYEYVYSGDKLLQMTVTDHTTSPETVQLMEFSYDAAGQPLTFTIDGVTYYYVLNIQGDVMGMVDGDGNLLYTMVYEGYGAGYYFSGGTAAATILLSTNPLGYRGYVMDTGTGLYYLQSRYYDPTLGRFLNADALVSTDQGLLGNNMLAYCRNNPVKRTDITGTTDECNTDVLDDGNPFNDWGTPNYNASGVGNNGYTHPDGGGGVTDSIQVDGTTVTFGHGGRHLSGSSLTTGEVNSAIANDVVGRNLSPNQFLPNGMVTVGDYRIGYTAYMLSERVINVGTYHII